jgi:hypothetical protein
VRASTTTAHGRALWRLDLPSSPMSPPAAGGPLRGLTSAGPRHSGCRGLRRIAS